MIQYSEEIVDYSKDIEYLLELITKIQNNVQFTIGVVLTVVGLALGVSGWALSMLNKRWVENAIKAKADNLDATINSLKTENLDLKEQLLTKVDYFEGDYHPEGTVTARAGSIYFSRKLYKTFIKTLGNGNAGWREL